MSLDPLTSWMALVAPDCGSEVAQAIESLPLRGVYQDPPQGAGVRPYCAEWSLRVSAAGLDLARVMVALDTQRCRAGQLQSTLASLPGSSKRLGALAEKLLSHRRDLDLLLGFALSESPPRAKLYVLQPSGRPVGDFSELCEGILGAAGVDPEWTRSQISGAGQSPAFLAIDLCGDGSSTGKLYFSFEHEVDADVWLEKLDARPLQEKLKQMAVHLSDNPNGRVVVTTRAAGAATRDVTLHAHLATLAELGPELESAWSELQRQARHEGHSKLHFSYGSWLWGENPAQSLYYTLA